MNTKLISYLVLIFCIFSIPVSTYAVTGFANKDIFIGQPGNPNYENYLSFDVQVAFTPPTQINQNTSVSVDIQKGGQGGTPYTGRAEIACSGCNLGASVFETGSGMGPYPFLTDLSVSSYGTRAMSVDITEAPSFVPSPVHTIINSSGPAVFTVTAPPQCSDGNDNDGDGTSDANDPGCWSCPGIPGSYVPSHTSETNPPTGGSCPVPFGIISASPVQCSIPLNGSQCSSTITWSTTNATTPVVEIAGNPFDSGASGSRVAPWINPNSSPYIFNLRNNSVSGSILDTVPVTAVCASGTWNGSSCTATPPPTYTCTVGANTSNATLCSGDDETLSANTQNTLVPACSPAKCEYTCSVGYELSGNSCVVSSGPTASINAPDCSIIIGQNSCTSNVSWDTDNMVSASVRQNGIQFSIALSSVGTPQPLSRGTHTFTVFDGATQRATDDATAECEFGSTWNVSTCVSNTGPVASIDAPNCTIIAGQSSCTSIVTWDTSGITPPSIRQNEIPFSTVISSVGTPRPLTRGIHTFTVYDGVTPIAFDDATAECHPSAPWNSSISACDGVVPSAPVVTISANSTSITSGNSSVLTWTVTGTADSCWASSGWSGWKTYIGTDTQSVFPTETTTYAITCYNEGVQSNTPTATVTVTGTPTAQNIGWTPAPVFDPQGRTVELAQGQTTTNQTLYVATSGSTSCALTGTWSGSASTRIEPVNDTSYAINVGVGNFMYTLACTDGFTKTASLFVNLYSGPSTPKLIICPVNDPVSDPVSVPVDQTRELHAWHWTTYAGTPTCANGGSTNVTADAGWISNAGTIATVSNSAPKGTLAGVSVGNAVITATYNSLSATKNVTVTAGSGGPYMPTITIVSNPSIVRSGQTAPVTVTITANYVLSCILSGAVSGNIDHTGLINTNVSNFTTVPLTAARVAKVTCTDPDGGSHSDETTISVIPTFQEI